MKASGMYRKLRARYVIHVRMIHKHTDGNRDLELGLYQNICPIRFIQISRRGRLQARGPDPI